jgi:hypothetical protein
MIAESLDARTLANMEVALERACKILSTGAEEHRVRRHIASKILKCAERGDKTLGGLTEAGRAAAEPYSVAAPRRKRAKAERDHRPIYHQTK